MEHRTQSWGQRNKGSMRKKLLTWFLCWFFVVLLSGCSAKQVVEDWFGEEEASLEENQEDGGNNSSDKTEEKKKKQMIKFTEQSDALTDNDQLYEEDQDNSVITMYLTVSTGNPSDHTNHTWKEVNSHDIYYYEDKDIDRFGVNGLLQVGDENGPIEGALGYSATVPNATVTIRGQTSSRNAQKNYKIKLMDEAGKWRDQSVINLNKHQSEGLRFRNKMAYDLMKKMPGMISLQTQFVHLYVKDTTEGGTDGFVDYGLYTQVEQPNKKFLKRHGFDQNGQLYKINQFEFYRYEDVIMLKSNTRYSQKKFEELIEIKGNDDHSKLIALLEDINDESVSGTRVLEKWFNLDNVTSWMAFQILIGNSDTQNRNTLLYSPLNKDTWYLISWDNDGCLSRYENQLVSGVTDRAWEQGISNYWGNMLYRKLLKTDVFREALDKKINEYKNLLKEQTLISMVNQYSRTLKPYVYGSADVGHAPIPKEKYDEVAKAVTKEVATNYEAYEKSLENPMPFFIGEPQVTNNKVKLNWEAAFDLQGDTVTYTVELSDRFDFEHVLATEKTKQIECTLKPMQRLKQGQYFVRVTATDSDGNKQYAFDYYISNYDDAKHYGVKTFYVE